MNKIGPSGNNNINIPKPTSANQNKNSQNTPQQPNLNKSETDNFTASTSTNESKMKRWTTRVKKFCSNLWKKSTNPSSSKKTTESQTTTQASAPAPASDETAPAPAAIPPKPSVPVVNLPPKPEILVVPSSTAQASDEPAPAPAAIPPKPSVPVVNLPPKPEIPVVPLSTAQPAPPAPASDETAPPQKLVVPLPQAPRIVLPTPNTIVSKFHNAVNVKGADLNTCINNALNDIKKLEDTSQKLDCLNTFLNNVCQKDENGNPLIPEESINTGTISNIIEIIDSIDNIENKKEDSYLINSKATSLEWLAKIIKDNKISNKSDNYKYTAIVKTVKTKLEKMKKSYQESLTETKVNHIKDWISVLEQKMQQPPALNPKLYNETMYQQALGEFKQKINEQNADIDSLIKNTLSTHQNPNDKGYLLNEIVYYFYYDSKYTTPNTIENLLNNYKQLEGCDDKIKGMCLANITKLALKLKGREISDLPDKLLAKYNDLNCDDDTKGDCLINIATLAYKLPEDKLPKTIKTLYDKYNDLKDCNDDTKGECLVHIGLAAIKTINNENVITNLQDCIKELPSDIKNNKEFKEDLNLIKQKLQITSVPSKLMNLIDIQDEANINNEKIQQTLKEYIENSDSDQNINDKIKNIVTLYNYIENTNIKNTLLQTTIDYLNDENVDCSKMDYTSLINLIKESNNIEGANKRNEIFGANIKLVAKRLKDNNNQNINDNQKMKDHEIDSIISRLRYLYPNIKDINKIDTDTIESFTQLLNEVSPKNSTVLTGQTKNKITSLLYQTYKQCNNNKKDLKSNLYKTIDELVPNFIKTKK